MRGPPMPSNATRGRRRLSSRMSPAASRSPDTSPATMPMRRDARVLREAGRRERPMRTGVRNVVTSADDAALRAFDEAKEIANFLVFLGQFFEALGGLRKPELGLVQDFVGPTQGFDGFVRESVAFQTTQVEAVRFRRIARRDHIGRDIHERNCPQRCHAIGADTAILMRHGEAAQDGVVAARDVARKTRTVGENGVVADLTVVRQMAIRHDEVVVAQARDTAARHRTAVEGAVLANDIAITDVEARGFALITQMLWCVAQRGELINAVVAPNARRSGNDNMGADPRALADLNLCADNAVSTDLDPFGNARLRMHDRLRVNHEEISLYVHISSALQQSSLPT